jgi:hypothetical protein
VNDRFPAALGWVGLAIACMKVVQRRAIVEGDVFQMRDTVHGFWFVVHSSALCSVSKALGIIFGCSRHGCLSLAVMTD